MPADQREEPSGIPDPLSEQEQLRLMVSTVRDYAILGLDVNGLVSSWNAGAELIKGYRAEEILGRHFSVFYPPEDVAAGKPERELIDAARIGRFEDEGWRVRRDGTRFWANVVITALFDDGGKLRGFGKVTRDVTDRRRSEEALREAQAFQEAVLVASPAVIALLDPATSQTIWASRSMTEVLGYSADRVVAPPADPVRQVLHADDLDSYTTANAAAAGLGPGETTELRHRVLHADGSLRWFLRRMTLFRHPDGRALVLAVSTDITVQVKAEEDLAYRALHDPLTGLPNRRLLADRLEQAMTRLDRVEIVGVLIVDLDGFKLINDRFGHRIGDEVLVAVAARLRSQLRGRDTVGRMGGDEFLIILHGTDLAAAADLAEEISRRVCVDLARPVTVEGIVHRLTASIGVAFARTGADTIEVLAAADAAMYRAKAAGKNTHVVSPFPP